MLTLEEAKERARKWHKSLGWDYAVRTYCRETDLEEGYHLLCLNNPPHVIKFFQYRGCRIVWCIRAGRYDVPPIGTYNH